MGSRAERLSELTGWYFVLYSCSPELVERAVKPVILCSTMD